MGLYYWGAYYNNQYIVDMFSQHLGVSPFMKMFDGGNLVIACIRGKNYDLLSHIVKDTRQNVNHGRSNSELIPAKYDLTSKFSSHEKVKYFWKSRECKDK